MEQALGQPKLNRSLRTSGWRGERIPSCKVLAISPVHVSIDGGRIHCGRGRLWAGRSATGNHRPDLFEDFLGLAIFQRRALEERERLEALQVGAVVTQQRGVGPNGLVV